MNRRYFATWLIAWVLIAAAPVQSAVFTLKGQNEARYRRGYPFGQKGGVSQSYFENSFEFNAGYSNYRFYLRQRYLLPSEFGVRQTGLESFDKRYLEYRTDQLTVHGGSFYRIWGTGLMFGTAERQELNFDNGLEGLLLESSFNRFEASFFKGARSDTLGGFIESAEGGWLTYRAPLGIALGTGVVYLEESALHPAVDRRGYEITAQTGPVGMSLTYSADIPAHSENFPSGFGGYPHGLYGSLSFGGFNWGAVLEYKNYRLLVEDPYSDTPQPLLQDPPTARPEATMTLLDRIPRVVKPYSDDVGFQLDLTASREFWSFHTNLNLGSELGSERILPSVRSDQSKYRGVFLSADRNDLEGNRLMLEGGYLEEIQVVPPVYRDQTYWYRRSGVGAEYGLPIMAAYSASAEMQLMWFKQLQEIPLPDGSRERSTFNEYRDELLQLSVSHSPDWSLTLAAMRSGDRNERGGLKWDDNRRYWPYAELMVNVVEGHQVRLMGGHERGGLRCSGGLCRWVNPFQGVKVTVTSQF